MGYLLFAILKTIALTMLISFIVYKFVKHGEVDSNDDNNKDEKKIIKIENILMYIGVLFIGFALSLPFLILRKYNFDLSFIKLKDFQDLGPVGDYLGGTTVGLLSLASLLFVAAAMMMQQKELELQRKEVAATRKEYEITNRTMKKQSFDSTFFNMINLHQSILNQVSIRESNGRVAFEKMYSTFKEFVGNNKSIIIDEILFKKLYGPDKRMALISDTFANVSNETLENIKSTFEQYIDDEKFEIFRYYNGDDEYKLYIDNFSLLLESLFENFEMKKGMITDEQSLIIFKLLANNGLLYNENIDLDSLSDETLKNFPNTYKKKLYEVFYNDNENMIGHYYRNYIEL